MPAYVVFGFGPTPEHVDLSAYREGAQTTIAAHGGRIIGGGKVPRSLEGGPFATSIIVEFDSVDTAQKWYDSPEYQAALRARLGARESSAWIVPPWAPPQRS